MSDDIIVTINNKTGNAVDFTDADGNPLFVPAYGSITGALDSSTYAKAIAIFGAANVVLSSAGAGGLDVATVPIPDWVLPIPTSSGYQGGATTVNQAILAELRVISLLLSQNTTMNIDLASLRADEVNNAIGSALN